MNKGFTLLETIIVIAITMILSAVTLGYNRSNEKQIALYRDQAIIVGLINRAKSLALQKFNVENACAFGVHFESPRGFTIFADKMSSESGKTVCKNISGVYQLNGTYDAGGEALTDEQTTFSLDNRLKFRVLTPPLNSDIIFVPPEMETKTNPASDPFIIQIETLDGSLCSSLEVGVGGQITEGNCL